MADCKDGPCSKLSDTPAPAEGGCCDGDCECAGETPAAPTTEEVVLEDSLSVRVVVPPAGTPLKGGIVWGHDIFGINTWYVKEITDKWARMGFLVALPDFFRGQVWADGRDFAEFPTWIAQFSWPQHLKDARTTAAELTRRGAAKLGFTGYCYGGKMAFLVAKDTTFAGSVSLHPARLERSDAEDLKAPVLLLAGGTDQHTAPEKIAALQEGHAATCPDIELKVHVFEGCPHGWAARMPGPQRDEALQETIDWLLAKFNATKAE